MNGRLASLLAIVALGSAAEADAQHFEPGPGLHMLASGATGVLDLGVVHFPGADVVLRALAHNGQVLQIHGRQGVNWLAKRSGSVGGKSLPPTTFDRLVALGGSDTDIRCSAQAVRDEFSRIAAIMLLEGTPQCHDPTRARQPQADAVQSSRSVRLSEMPSGCAPIGCRLLFQHGHGPEAFSIQLDEVRQLWGFAGNGIVAIWAVPGS